MALMLTLADSFPGTSLSALWTVPGGTVTVSGGMALLTCGTTYSRLVSASAYDLTGSHAYCLLNPAFPASGGYQTGVRLGDVAGSNCYGIEDKDGFLRAYYTVAGTTTVVHSVAYSATSHAWVKISESGGTVTWSTAPDGVTWTVQATSSEPVAVTSLFAVAYSGRYSPSVSDGTSYLAAFNVTPSVAPAWLAARAGLTADTAAVNASQHVDQFLAAHGITPVYAGAPLVTPSGLIGYGYGGLTSTSLGVSDVDQPFTLPGGHTAAGRVTVPLVPSGNGADVTVSLCADSGGSPGTVLASTTVPREHLAQLAVPGAPLATAQSSVLLMGDMTTSTWASPVSGSGSPAVPSLTQSGSYALQAGGQVSGAFVANAYTVGWQGGSAPGTALPQPPLPAATDFGTLIATSDTLVYAGGTAPNVSTLTAAVWTAGWSPSSGQVQAWTAGTSLPAAVYSAGGGFDPATDTVYIAGGAINNSGVPTTAVWRAQVVNGQLGAWAACPPLPAARMNMVCGAASGWLLVAGGQDASAVVHADLWLAKINPDGSLGSWVPGPPMPAGMNGQNGGNAIPVAGGLVIVGGFNSYTAAATNLFQALTVTADGPGQWSQQALNPTPFAETAGINCPVAAFPLTSGQWQVITVGNFSGQYSSGVMQAVPSVSVPLPATGLTGGGTYHILLHQQGGDAADYVSVVSGPGAQAASGKTRPAGGGSWTTMSGHLYSVYAGVFDQTASGTPLHLWEDSGARYTTLLYGTATGQLLGVLEATAFPAGSPRPAMAAVAQVQYGSTGQPSGLVTLA